MSREGEVVMYEPDKISSRFKNLPHAPVVSLDRRKSIPK